VTLTKEDGLKVAIKQIAFYAANWFTEYAKRETFIEEATTAVIESYLAAKDGYGVKRGVELERIAYKANGKTEAEFRAYLVSQD